MIMHSLLVEGIEFILSGIAGFCLRRSLKFQDFLSVAKRSFVFAAEAELAKSNIEISLSRLSVMTGLQRPDIEKILNNRAQIDNSRSIISRVIGKWSNDISFRSKNGKIKTLTYEGRDSEFFELVSSVSREINAYAVLFDLERLGHVEKSEKGLKLLSSGLVASDDLKDGLRMLAFDSNELCAAVEANMFDGQEIPNLHLHAHCDNILKESLPEVRRWCLEEGSKFVRTVQKHLATYDCDLNPSLAGKEGGGRVTFGAFSRVVDR
jgi:hypothetical protein